MTTCTKSSTIMHVPLGSAVGAAGACLQVKECLEERRLGILIVNANHRSSGDELNSQSRK